MSHTDSPVGYTHSDGEVICPECHKSLGMDQASECTAVFDPSIERAGVEELAGKCCAACDCEYLPGYHRNCSDGDLEWIDARWYRDDPKFMVPREKPLWLPTVTVPWNELPFDKCDRDNSL